MTPPFFQEKCRPAQKLWLCPVQVAGLKPTPTVSDACQPFYALQRCSEVPEAVLYGVILTYSVICLLMRQVRHELLNLMDFTSERARMSVITRAPDGTIRLFCKGADGKAWPRAARACMARHREIAWWISCVHGLLHLLYEN